MGLMKRIATARIWNPKLWGGREDPELEAMRKVYLEQTEQAPDAGVVPRHQPPGAHNPSRG